MQAVVGLAATMATKMLCFRAFKDLFGPDPEAPCLTRPSIAPLFSCCLLGACRLRLTSHFFQNVFDDPHPPGSDQLGAPLSWCLLRGLHYPSYSTQVTVDITTSTTSRAGIF